ncbi:MAG: hypothetical protein ACQESG_06210 [Nanobdellota archaeon]
MTLNQKFVEFLQEFEQPAIIDYGLTKFPLLYPIESRAGTIMVLDPHRPMPADKDEYLAYMRDSYDAVPALDVARPWENVRLYQKSVRFI